MSVNRTDAYVPENDEFTTEALAARPSQSSTNAIGAGWDAAEIKASDFPQEFKFVDGTIQIVKFIDEDGPFAVYRQHFLTQKTEGKRSYVSLGANDPLCTKLGSKPEEKRAFTIINLSAPGMPRQMLIASTRLFKTLHAAHFSPQGPLNKSYWALSRTGKMQTTMYHVNPVKGRDLQEDWSINEEEANKAVASAVPFTRADIKEPTWEELEAVAASLS